MRSFVTRPWPGVAVRAQRERRQPLCRVTDSSSSPSLPLALETGCWLWERGAGTPRALWAAPGTGSLQLSRQHSSSENVRPCMGPPRCCPGHGAGGAESISHPAGCWPDVRPCYVPPLCLFSTDLGHLDGLARGKKSRSLPAAGQGWRQLHHGGSLQPPCGCSLPAQPASPPAQAHLSSSSSQLKLIPAHARHVLVACPEALACRCTIRPCL